MSTAAAQKKAFSYGGRLTTARKAGQPSRIGVSDWREMRQRRPSVKNRPYSAINSMTAMSFLSRLFRAEEGATCASKAIGLRA